MAAAQLSAGAPHMELPRQQSIGRSQDDSWDEPLTPEPLSPSALEPNTEVPWERGCWIYTAGRDPLPAKRNQPPFMVARDLNSDFETPTLVLNTPAFVVMEISGVYQITILRSMPDHMIDLRRLLADRSPWDTARVWSIISTRKRKRSGRKRKRSEVSDV